MQRHPYCVLGGGDDNQVHDPSKTIPRPSYLVYNEDNARFCKVAGMHGLHNIYYEVIGRGPRKILLLMGLGGCHTQFEEQLKYFGVENGDKYTVCLVDNRGVGFSDTPTGRWRTLDMACDMFQLLVQLENSNKPGEGAGWKSNVHVVGFSMGGMVAQELILMDCKRFTGSLTLISTHAGGLWGSLPPTRGLLRMVRAFTTLEGPECLDAGMDILFPVEHLDLTCQAPEEGVEIKTNREKYAFAMIKRARKYVESGNAPEIRPVGVVSQILAVVSHYVSWDRLKQLRSYNLQVLVVSGDQDNLVNPSNSRMLSDILDGRWLHFKDGGHGVNEQYADKVNEAIEECIIQSEKKDGHVERVHKRPAGPGWHPLHIIGAMSILYIISRNTVLSKLKPNLPRRLLAMVIGGIIIRRRFGGFYAP
mmetsp:Transcript_4585/g.6835  ORF Transcript_4585/g.6835 Transcript_4585/m.6835 type:complete len:419 (-) Transcript_4585:105-1361(-)